MDLDPLTIGGYGAGAFAAVKWLLGWTDRRRRDEDREQKAEAMRLLEWRNSLDRREKAHREEIEVELADMKAELDLQGKQQAIALALLMATRTALHEVTVKLRQHDPDAIEIEHAEALLRPGFLDPQLFKGTALPPDLAELLRKIDQRST